MSLKRDSNLGELGFQVAQDEIAQKKFKRKTSYQKYAEEDQFKIGKYASENGAIAAVRKLRNSYPDMKESKVQGFKSNYEEELKKAKRQTKPMTKALSEKKRGHPLMLGAIDLMVQDYLKVKFPFITFFPDKRNYTAYHINYLLTFFEFLFSGFDLCRKLT